MGKLILAEGPAPKIEDLYIMLPNGSYVREDYFDDLTDVEFNRLMNMLEPETMSESEFLSGRAERRAEREARREARRTAKTERVQAGGGFANVVKNLAKGASAIFGGASPSFDDQTPQTRGVSVDLGLTTGQQPERKWYQNPAVLIGGAAAVGITIYLLTRKKEK